MSNDVTLDDILSSMIDSMAKFDPAIKEHWENCKECKSMLAGTLKIALEDLMQNGKIMEALQMLTAHVKESEN